MPLFHLLLSPSTKVEESFNLQATHDLLTYGVPLTSSVSLLTSTYDHFTFPGAVPRTFVGAVILAGFSQPVVALVGPENAQYVVRAVLGAVNAAALVFFRKKLGRAFGDGVGRWWVTLLVSQFHVVYYLTRTLPNMLAFSLSKSILISTDTIVALSVGCVANASSATVASALTLPSSNGQTSLLAQKQCLALLTLSAVIFRAELALLLFTTFITLNFVLPSRPSPLPLQKLVPTFLACFLTALLLSVPLDSYFWQRPLWPELSGFIFNVLHGSSSEWGVSPWHYYFTSALPRLLLNPLAYPLIINALTTAGTSSQARLLFIPSFLFLVIYSFQPHKEARFIFYVVPPFTAVAALAANYISVRASRSLAGKVLRGGLVLSILLSAAASTTMLLISSLNYPGGDAVTELYQLAAHETGVVRVHADVFTCMTGLTLFGQNPHGLPISLLNDSDILQAQSTINNAPAIFLFDKTEESARLTWPSFWREFDYVLMENSSQALGRWELLGVVHGFAGVELLRPGQKTGGEAEGKVLGTGRLVRGVRDLVRKASGGWWIGPRMAPRINIMRRIKDGEVSR